MRPRIRACNSPLLAAISQPILADSRLAAKLPPPYHPPPSRATVLSHGTDVMIQWMHGLSKSWMATLLMGALTLSFMVWGIADVFTGTSTTAVASVGGTAIGPAEFQPAYRNLLRN